MSCFVTTSNSRPALHETSLSRYRRYVPEQKALPASALSQNTFLLGRPTVLGRAGCRCTSVDGTGQGQGQGRVPHVSLVPTLSSAPRVCCELELPKGRGRRTLVPQGSVIALPSAGFALEHCRISLLVSRLPSRLVSRFDPSASSIKVYVPVAEYVHHYMQSSTAQQQTV